MKNGNKKIMRKKEKKSLELLLNLYNNKEDERHTHTQEMKRNIGATDAAAAGVQVVKDRK